MAEKPKIGETITIELVRGIRETGVVVAPIKTDPPTWTRLKLSDGQHRLARPGDIINV